MLISKLSTMIIMPLVPLVLFSHQFRQMKVSHLHVVACRPCVPSNHNIAHPNEKLHVDRSTV